MTTQKDLPEEATHEPRILSPDEEAERALRALEEAVKGQEHGEDPTSLADPHNPLRMPGELSAKPREHHHGDHLRTAATKRTPHHGEE